MFTKLYFFKILSSSCNCFASIIMYKSIVGLSLIPLAPV